MNTVSFKSGISFGSGKTSQLDEVRHGKIMYLDTPGLADIKMRQAAASAITEALKQNGQYQVFFVVTLSAGRLRPEDLTTIWLVLLNATDIKIVNIIINKLSKEERKSLKSNKKILSSSLLGPLNMMDREIVYNFLLLRHNQILEDADNTIVKNPRLVKFVKKTLWIDVHPCNVHDIPGDDDAFNEQLDSLRNRMKNLPDKEVPMFFKNISIFSLYCLSNNFFLHLKELMVYIII